MVAGTVHNVHNRPAHVTDMTLLFRPGHFHMWLSFVFLLKYGCCN